MHLPTDATHDTLAARVEVVSWPAAAKLWVACRTAAETLGLSYVYWRRPPKTAAG